MRLAFIAAIALCSSAAVADAWDRSKFNKDHHWQTTVDDDEFIGRSVAVQAPAFTDEDKLGLVTIRKLRGEIDLTLTDASNFFCPDPAMDDLRVNVWFSDTKQVMDMKWQVSDNQRSIFPYSGDSAAIVDRMLAAPKTIFRVMDKCGDTTDYMVSGTNGREEFVAAGF